MREKEDFRAILERISNFFDGKEVLSKKEVARYTGLDVRTVAKRFDFNQNMISIVKLARQLS